MSKQKFEVELEVPNGYEVVAFREPFSGDIYLPDGGSIPLRAREGMYYRAHFILRQIPKYREPVLPADWGKTARFSYDGNEWVEGRLASYAAHYADDKHRWGSVDKPYWYAYCQVLDE